MIEPSEKDIGRKVIYGRDDEFKDTEYGVITSYNDSYVFVRYGTSQTSQATSRDDLVWDA